MTHCTTERVPQPAAPPVEPRELAAIRRACDATRERFFRIPGHVLRHAPLMSKLDASLIAELYRNADEARLVADIVACAALLSDRGLPTLVLEAHLQNVARELRELGPGFSAYARRLSRAASALRTVREDHLPEQRCRLLAADFVTEVEPSEDNQFVARLVTAAVSDEAAGVTNAVTGLLSWLAGARSRPAPHLTAVEHLIRATRIEIRFHAAQRTRRARRASPIRGKLGSG